MRKCIRDIIVSTAAVLVIGAIAWGSQVSAASFLEECKVEHHKDNLIKNGYAKDGDTSNWTGSPKVLKDTHSSNFFFVQKGGKRKRCGTNSHLFPVDSTKTYELSGWFKATAPEVNLVFGLFVYNKEKRFIASTNINEVKGTLTELIAPCEPGSKILKVKDASKWKASRSHAVAFDPKKDLPNFNIAKSVTLVEKTDNGYLIHLSNPCGFKYQAGTKIVQTRGSSNGIYVAACVVPVPGKWTKFSGIIKGEVKALSMKSWWSGTKYARAVIISRFRDENAELLFDNIVVKQVKATNKEIL